jgi:hypothetical protein
VRLRDCSANGGSANSCACSGPRPERLGLSTALALTVEPWMPAGLVAPLRSRFGAGKDRVMTPRLRALTADPRHPLPHAPATRSAFAGQLAFDTLQRLLPSLLRYEDRNSMAFSIETRLPFLDYRWSSSRSRCPTSSSSTA